MDDRLELGEVDGIAEDDPRQRRPVERGVGRPDAVPEQAEDRVVRGLAGRGHLAGDDVGVDDDGAALGEPAGDGRLAAADRARSGR